MKQQLWSREQLIKCPQKCIHWNSCRCNERALRNFSSWMDGPVCTSVSWNCIGDNICKGFITALHWWVGSGISDTFPWLWWLGFRKPQWSNRRLSKRKSQKDVYNPLSCVHVELVPSDSPIFGLCFWLFCGTGAQNYIIGLLVSNR